MGRPRKLETLTETINGRVRVDQWWWLKAVAERRFDGEMSKALRWALDQASTFDLILSEPNPVAALDEMLNPFEPQHPEDEIAEAERELEAWKNEQAIKRAQKKAAEQAKAPTSRRKPGATK